MSLDLVVPEAVVAAEPVPEGLMEYLKQSDAQYPGKLIPDAVLVVACSPSVLARTWQVVKEAATDRLLTFYRISVPRCFRSRFRIVVFS